MAAAAGSDFVILHNKAQFLAGFFEALATVKQTPATLKNHVAFGRATSKHFLKPHFRMQRIAQQKIALDKAFDAGSYTVTTDVLRQMDTVKGNAALMGAIGKVEEAVKGQRQPSLPESLDVMQELSKQMQIPQLCLKPAVQSMVNSGYFDLSEVDDVTKKVAANPFTPDQVWDAVADRMEAAKDGRVASQLKLGKSPTAQQQNVTRAGYFQIVDVPKDKQFVTMPITPALANAMACGPQRASFTHLDACDHPAARNLIEDLTNILLIGTNVADVDRDKSVAVTLRSIAQDPMAVSFRTIIDKSVSQPAPSGKAATPAPGPGTDLKKSTVQAPPAPGETNVMEVFDKLKTLGQNVAVPLTMLEPVFAQLVAGNVATKDEADKAKAELQTKADDKGQVSFEAIQQVLLTVFGTKLGAPK